MQKHSTGEWIAVTRYWSFSVSAMPVAVTFAYLCYKGLVLPDGTGVVNFILALLGTVALHAGGNILSDWSDYRSGVDNKDAFAVPNLVFGKFEAGEYLRAAIFYLVIGSAIGILLVFRTGFPLLLIGGSGVLLTTAYSFLKYHALGDIDIFIIFSVLIILGTSYVVSGSICADALVLAIPLGTITVSVLHANNTIDIKSDSDAGIRTFAMILGGRVSCRLYRCYMVIPFLCIAGAVIAGALPPLCLLTLAAAYPAWLNFRAAGHYDLSGTETMKGLDQGSAKLQLIFSGLLAITLFISAAF